MGSYFFALAGMRRPLIQVGKFAQTMLELRPSLDSLADLSLCTMRNIVVTLYLT